MSSGNATGRVFKVEGKHAQTQKGVKRIAVRGVKGLLLAFVFVLLFYAEEDWRGRRLWNQYHARAAQQVDFNWRQLAPPSIPEEENFAATPFFAALFDLVPGTHTPRDLQAYNRVAGFAQGGEPYLEARHPERALLVVVPGERSDFTQALRFLGTARRPSGEAAGAIPQDRSAQAAALLDILRQFDPVLNELRLAVHRPEARFPLNYKEETPWAVSQPHLPVLKRVGMVLGLRALTELAQGDARSAAGDLHLLTALANELAQEPCQAAYWTRVEILGFARQVLWEGLTDHRWSDRQLQDFQDYWRDFDLMRDLSKPLLLDRAHGEYLFGLLFKRQATVSGWRFGPGLGNALLPYVLRWMPSGWMDRERMTYHQRFDEGLLRGLGANAGNLRPRIVQQAADHSWPVWRHTLLASRLLESPVESIIEAALAQTRINEAIVACGLERYRLEHGGFPASLAVLCPQYLGQIPTDLITGMPLHYRPGNDGSYLLYSVGWNEKDEGGQAILDTRTHRLDSRSGDWVWPR
jgi:hypothetical protein